MEKEKSTRSHDLSDFELPSRNKFHVISSTMNTSPHHYQKYQVRDINDGRLYKLCFFSYYHPLTIF